MRKKRVFIFCMGFARRDLDAQRLFNYFSANDCDMIRNPNKSDLNILVTCAFTKNREDEAISLIKRFKKYRGELIVLGCLPGIAPERLKREFGGRSLPAKDLGAIDTLFPEFKVKFRNIPDSGDPYINKIEYGLIERFWTDHAKPFIREFEPPGSFLIKFMKRQANRIRSLLKNGKDNTQAQEPQNIYCRPLGPVKFLRVGGGCLGKCTYCAIRFATGELRSKPLEECVRDFANYISRGNRRFFLCAEDVGAYGLDIGTSFSELLSGYEEASSGIPYKLAIDSFNPWWIVKYKDKIIEMNKAGRIESIDCPIQSGSVRILRLMNRYPDLEILSSTLSEIMAAGQGVEYYSQFIVGFPSEEEKDFRDTLGLINKLNLNAFVLSPYSDMDGTAASKMPDKIPAHTVSNRIDLAIKAFEKGYSYKYFAETGSYQFMRR